MASCLKQSREIINALRLINAPRAMQPYAFIKVSRLYREGIIAALLLAQGLLGPLLLYYGHFCTTRVGGYNSASCFVPFYTCLS